MLRMLVAIGPWMTRSSTGIASAPKAFTMSWPGSACRLIVATVAPRTPSQITGMNWPRVLAAYSLSLGMSRGTNRE